MTPETATKIHQFLLVLTPTIPAMLAWASSLANKKKLKEIHVQFNSRFDEMIKAVKATAHSEGMAEQRRVDELKNKNPDL